MMKLKKPFYWSLAAIASATLLSACLSTQSAEGTVASVGSADIGGTAPALPVGRAACNPVRR